MLQHILFTIIIAVALALDIFGALVNRGALLVKFDKRVAGIVAMCSSLQLAAACVGYGLGNIVLQSGMKEHSIYWVNAFAGVLLAVIGIRMLVQAVLKNRTVERRMDGPDVKKDLQISLVQCINASLGGAVCGILRYDFLLVVIAVALATVIFAAVGFISGRIFGPAPSKKAYAIGGGLLCILSIVLQF